MSQLYQVYGHQGLEQMLELIDRWCLWPGMMAYVKSCSQHCDWCVKWPKTLSPRPDYMGHLLASQPNEILAIDFTFLEPSCNEMESVLVISDVFTILFQPETSTPLPSPLSW